MGIIGIALLTQLAGTARQSLPVLSFPDPLLDDTAAYQGYQTRFYEDAAGNTVQIYVDQRTGRVVFLLANAADESAGFTVRDRSGKPTPVSWTSSAADVWSSGRRRSIALQFSAEASEIHIGWPLLGSMRVERDFQYQGKHRAPYSDPPFVLPELEGLVGALRQLDPAEQRAHLALLHAPSLTALQARLRPSSTTSAAMGQVEARWLHPSIDGRDTISLAIRARTRDVFVDRTSTREVTLRARSGNRVAFTAVVSTTARPLTPLARQEIFTADFLRFLASVDSASPRGRWLERQVRGVELLASREKLMAGLPAYATYFGRDMLLSALMMRPIWRDEMSEFVVASALRRLSPRGDVSHEEALGGQAAREAAADYARLVQRYRSARARGESGSPLRDSARVVLRDIRRTRENYHMIDDEFQLPIVAARWLMDPGVSGQRKRAFLLDSTDSGEPRLRRLLREFALVARMTAAYVASPVAVNLVSFPQRDSTHWSSASWRDSGAGYAGGRFAMDVNAIWAPRALEAIGAVVRVLPTIGLHLDSIAASMPELTADTPLGSYIRDTAALARATDTWWSAARHFLLTLPPDTVRARVARRLAALPAAEQHHWRSVLDSSGAERDGISFLALALDGEGTPIAVANTDPATRLFLGDRPGTIDEAAALRDARLFVRPYPVGLFIADVGPVVANDAYAAPTVWPEFERDRYHGPRVVWGREVNLFLLGVANHIAAAPPGHSAYADTLVSALRRVRDAANASGFHSELWSYELRDGRMVPVRYGTGSDVQLWSTTDLAVQFVLEKLVRREEE